VPDITVQKFCGCQAPLAPMLKVALSQKRLDDFYISKINIPNHYPEQKISISRLKLFRIVIWNIYFGVFQYLLTLSHL
jgi:hypothetical protein